MVNLNMLSVSFSVRMNLNKQSETDNQFREK